MDEDLDGLGAWEDDLPEAPLEVDAEDAPDRAERYRCRACKHAADKKWFGPCPNRACGSWHTPVKRKGDGGGATLAKALTAKPRPRIPTGIPEVDRVLNGGLAGGSVILLGGKRGGGKTTVLLQIADAIARAGKRVYFACGEMPEDQVLEYALRVGATHENVRVKGDEYNLYRITDVCEAWKPHVLFIDSIQVIGRDDVKAAEGTASQIEACAQWITSFAQRTKTAIVITCHMTGLGDFAGGEKLQHLVSAILRLGPRGPPGHPLEDGRELSIEGKSRLGPSNLREMMEMDVGGLKPLSPELRRKIAEFERKDEEEEDEGEDDRPKGGGGRRYGRRAKLSIVP